MRKTLDDMLSTDNPAFDSILGFAEADEDLADVVAEFKQKKQDKDAAAAQRSGREGGR